MKEVLVINGSGGVGKDTFIELLSKHIKTRKSSIIKIPKRICKIFGWVNNKDEPERKFLCDLKGLIDRYNDANYKSIKECYNNFIKFSPAEVLCLCMREKDDIERAVKDFGAKKVLITRSSVKQIISNHADKHVFDIEYDYIIRNDGSIKDLELKAKELINQIKSKVTTDVPKYEHIIYVSHPYQGNPANKHLVEDLIKKYIKRSPNTLFVSPISTFGFEYDVLTYKQGINQCLWLLSKCTAMLLTGDWENSSGCKAEIEFCKTHNIPILEE